jgi:TIR domain-containing protein
MYFEESSKLIKDNLQDKDLIRSLDRELARSFAPLGTGFIELSLLGHRTETNFADVERLMSLYEKVGVVSSFNKVMCPNNHSYRPDENQCPECGRDLSEAAPTNEKAYAILKQPQMPAFDPDTAGQKPDVFISYRTGDSAKLAADIYYSLLAEGYQVFLDAGEIPPGADAEKQFLTAASNAGNFISLVSENYFFSDFCKKEIAHAARCRRRLIRVNVPPVPSAPGDMTWIDDPSWLRQQGDASGLSTKLEEALLNAVRTPASPATIADNRYGACQFLLEQMTFDELNVLWNRLEWMRRIRPYNSASEMIMQLQQNTPDAKRDVLCTALSP